MGIHIVSGNAFRRNAVERALVSNERYSASSRVVDSIDVLRRPVEGADTEIVQLGRGRMAGEITHATVGDVSFSKGSFSLPIRSEGIFSRARLTIGAYLDCLGPVKARLGPAVAGDLMINPPGFDHHCVYAGRTTYAGLSIDTIEMATILGGENALSDPDFWLKARQCSPQDPRATAQINACVLLAFARLTNTNKPSGGAADYIKRTVVEAFAAPIIDASVVRQEPSLPSAVKLIREAERFVDERSYRPVHISELCSHLKVSRRTLQRCFDDVLGVGPGAFLRQKRLCHVHSALRRLDGRTAQVTQVATDYGFLELGRFSQQYHALFGEYPSETLHGRSRRKFSRTDSAGEVRK